ncbi:MAG TPA: hypothetical protein VIV40_30205 [Kofleriaceae bacterium]
MRWLVFAIAITAASHVAVADDGYYLEEGLGGGSYNGELGRFGDGAPRLQIGFAARRGSVSYEAFGSFLIPDLFFIDCYGEECAYAARPQAGLGAFGVDVRKRWRLLSLRRWGKPGVYERPGLFVALHGGPRWFVGSDAIQDYQGPGLGGGAALEGDIWIFGYFADVGMDVMRLSGPNDTLHGSMPYVMFGVKIGWL